MPSTSSKQTMDLQDELEEERKRREEQQQVPQAAVAAQAVAEAQQQQQVAQQAAAASEPTTPANPQAPANPATENAAEQDNGGVPVDHTVSDAMAQANAEMEQAGAEANAQNAQNNQDYQNYLANLVQGYQNDLAEAKKEAELQKKIDTNKTVFAGVTEFASALANLIGTGQGAVNQQPKTYTQDWMREADQHRQQERERLDRMREKLREQEQQGAATKYSMTREQIARELELRKQKAAGAVDVAKARKAEEEEAYERGQAAEIRDDKNTQFAQTLALNVLKENNRHQEQMAKAGVTGVKRSGNGDYTVTYKKDYKSGSGSGSGSGSSKNNIITIPKVGSMPEVRYHVPLDMVHQLVYDYIKAGSVNDLDEEGMQIYEELNKASALQVYGSSQEKVAETSEKLRPLIAHSPTLREAVRLLELELKNLKDDEEEKTDEDDDFPSVDDDGFPNP